MDILITSVILIVIFLAVRKMWSKDTWKMPNEVFNTKWRQILSEKVAFYNALSDDDKTRFEFKVQEFLLNTRITGIDVKIDDTDRILVAASAVIPIFHFSNWKYINLYEVLIYPSSFNKNFETSGEGRNILGMVGYGFMEGKMILSKQALHRGFSNESDKKNTAIHEFVHLIDKMDGAIDGIPELLLEKQYTIPWLDLINQKIDDIYKNKSEINPYGGTNKAEFFAVVSEYFFERPKLLQKKHPELYKLLEEIFDQKMTSRDMNKIRHSIGRNDLCPCRSGKKFKKCCGKVHYS
ncbi:MAG: zinc-dependent peptidase [Flavobacteriales bacterium]|nr:zinc-dependent peptidase [Flavobacteriales bacterium]